VDTLDPSFPVKTIKLMLQSENEQSLRELTALFFFGEFE
jgi:hypothetical protein